MRKVIQSWEAIASWGQKQELDVSLRNITPTTSLGAHPISQDPQLDSGRAAWICFCDLTLQCEHWAITLPRAEVAAYCSVLLALPAPQLWICSAEVFEMLMAALGRTRRCTPHYMPLFELRARPWTRAHQVILPIGLQLPEMMKVTWCVLFQSKTGDVQAVKWAANTFKIS